MGGQSLKPLIYCSSCVSGPGVCRHRGWGFFQFTSEMSGDHIFYTVFQLNCFVYNFVFIGQDGWVKGLGKGPLGSPLVTPWSPFPPLP